MNWKLKSFIQNAISLLPSEFSYETYYQAQRAFGGLRKPNPSSRIKAAVSAWEILLELGIDPQDSSIFEVGTGRVPIAPMTLWLLGAESCKTVDLNPYIKKELVFETLDYLRRYREEFENLGKGLFKDQRLESLYELDSGISLEEFLHTCAIDYMAPADASDTGLPDSSVDIHFSYTVLEHIPSAILSRILKESARILKPTGYLIHRIDYSDHFSHSDPSISSINFLQYDDLKWKKLAGNRYMYMNRLRHDDYLELFRSQGLEVIYTRPDVDSSLRELIPSLKLNQKFTHKPDSILEITGSWIVAKPPQGGVPMV